MRVGELTGAKLDYWVAKAEGADKITPSDLTKRIRIGERYGIYSPSTDWSQGGPIIQNNFIELAWNGDPSECKASWMHNNGVYSWQFGPDALTAAMRCYVAARFGEEVDDSQAD
jgi:hypothetical protein